MQREVSKRTAERVAAGEVVLVTIAGEDAVVFHGDDYRESITVLDDALGYCLADRFEAAGPEQTVVVFVGDDSSAAVQMVIEKRRLEAVVVGAGGRS